MDIFHKNILKSQACVIKEKYAFSKIKRLHFSVSDANVRKQLQRVEEKLNRELQKEKAMYRGMFSPSLKSGSGEGINQTNGAGGGL